MAAQTMKQAATATTALGREQGNQFSERVGSTVYRVTVRFPEAETETLEEKITRLIKNDLQFQQGRGILDTLQTGRLPNGGSL
ncbi:MAG: transposon-encoded TnpW family protein [Clostridiales bacterium]|jgi:hypothetical protein|nr:transposon-encoded TnpW family protein [Clostridiales bacterium]